MLSLPSGSIAFLVGNLSAAVASHAIVECFFTRREAWRRWLAGCVSFILLIACDLLVVGTIGLLRPAYVTGFMVVAAGLCVFMARSLMPHFALPGGTGVQATSSAEPAGSDLHFMQLLATAMLVLFVIGPILRMALWPPQWFNDDFAYHATNVVQWILDERLSVGALNDHAYWPLNSELIPLWLILPFRADGMAVWSGVPWLMLAAVAMIGLASAQRLDWSIGIMTIALVAASPNIAWMLRTFSAADFSGPAMLLASIAFLAPSVTRRSTSIREEEWLQARSTASPSVTSLSSPTVPARRARMVDMVFAGLAGGFAIGCKVPFVFAVAFLGLWGAFAQKPRLYIRDRFKHLALFATAVFATGTYWYARNWILTGNPLFPGEVWPFAGPVTLSNAQPTLFQWMLQPPVRSAWIGFIESYVGSWPLGLGLLALLAFGAAVGSWFRRNEQTADSVRFILSVTSLILLASHPFMPFSGPYPVESPNPTFVPRYVISVFVLGMALMAPLLGVARPGRWLWWTLAILALVTTLIPGKLVFALTALALAAVLVVARLPRQWPLQPWQFMALGYATFIVAIVGLALYSTRSQEIVDRYILDEYAQKVGPGWRALEHLPIGSRIAWFDNYGWEYYPIYGRHWQLVPYRVNRDGTQFQPVHVNWRTLAEGQADSPYVMRNVLAGQAEYIFISKHRSDQWPPQYWVISRSGRVQQLYDDGYSAIFKVLREKVVAPQ